MEKLNMVIIGVGAIGTKHAHLLYSEIIEDLNLYGLVVRNADQRAKLAARYPGVKLFAKAKEVFLDEQVAAVLIATPHMEHDKLCEQALRYGKHVLVEKPLAIDTGSAQHIIEFSQKYPELTFAMMLNQRTLPAYQQIQALLATGDLGPIQRIAWTRTDWFRPQSYFDKSKWRGTWEKEGGGLLLNQAAHLLDLWQYLFGMPQEVIGFSEFGKYRTIEVDDEDTAVFRYGNGVKGTLVTSVAETPGVNRLEIVTSFGKIVLENDTLTVFRVDENVGEFNDRFTDTVAGPTYTAETIEQHEHFNAYQMILQNFADHINQQKPLIAPATEGLNGVMLANAIYLSTWQNRPIRLPLDANEYAQQLSEKMKAPKNVLT